MYLNQEEDTPDSLQNAKIKSRHAFVVGKFAES